MLNWTAIVITAFGFTAIISIVNAVLDYKNNLKLYDTGKWIAVQAFEIYHDEILAYVCDMLDNGMRVLAEEGAEIEFESGDFQDTGKKNIEEFK